MGQVRADDSPGVGPANRVAGAATIGQKQALALGGERSRRLERRRLLPRKPTVKRFFFFAHHVEAHQGMRSSTVFCTGTAKNAGLGRRQCKPRYTSRNHVDFAAESGDPEGVDDIGALQSKLHRLTHRETDLIGEFDCRGIFSRPEVAYPPPPLLAGDRDSETTVGGRCNEFGQQAETVSEGSMSEAARHHR